VEGATVIPFPRKPVREVPLSKRAMAQYLGYSVRWLEIRTSEGLPSHKGPNGRREYLLSEVLAYLDDRRGVRLGIDTPTIRKED
jgi:hypothetical protein